MLVLEGHSGGVVAWMAAGAGEENGGSFRLFFLVEDGGVNVFGMVEMVIELMRRLMVVLESVQADSTYGGRCGVGTGAQFLLACPESIFSVEESSMVGQAGWKRRLDGHPGIRKVKLCGIVDAVGKA